MSRETCQPLVVFITPDLTAQMTPEEAFTPMSELTEPLQQQISDNAYAYCGRQMLGQYRADTIKNPDFDELFCPEPASLEDWECLEAEDADLHHRISTRALKALTAQKIPAPFTAKVAEVHSLDEARAKKQTESALQSTSATIEVAKTSQP